MLPHPRYTAAPTCKKGHPGIGLPPSARQATLTILAFLSGLEKLSFWLRPNWDDCLAFGDVWAIFPGYLLGGILF
jgi:hypothetical protein